jgi:hypothetical protein
VYVIARIGGCARSRSTEGSPARIRSIAQAIDLITRRMACIGQFRTVRSFRSSIGNRDRVFGTSSHSRRSVKIDSDDDVAQTVWNIRGCWNILRWGPMLVESLRMLGLPAM